MARACDTCLNAMTHRLHEAWDAVLAAVPPSVENDDEESRTSRDRVKDHLRHWSDSSRRVQLIALARWFRRLDVSAWEPACFISIFTRFLSSLYLQPIVTDCKKKLQSIEHGKSPDGEDIEYGYMCDQCEYAPQCACVLVESQLVKQNALIWSLSFRMAGESVLMLEHRQSMTILQDATVCVFLAISSHVPII